MLHVDTLLHIEFNLRKAELRKHMKARRPEVKRLGFGSQKDNGTMDGPPALGPRIARPWAVVAPNLLAAQVVPVAQVALVVQVTLRRQFRKALCCVVQ